MEDALDTSAALFAIKSKLSNQWLDTTHFTDVTGLVYYHISHPIVPFLIKTIEKKEFNMLETVSAFTLIDS